MPTFEYRDQPPNGTIIEVLYKDYTDSEHESTYRDLWLRDDDSFSDYNWHCHDKDKSYNWIDLEYSKTFAPNDKTIEGNAHSFRTVTIVNIVRWGEDGVVDDDVVQRWLDSAPAVDDSEES